MTEDEREIDLQLGELLYENRKLKMQLDAALTETLQLRHKLEHIYALTKLALSRDEPTRGF